MGAQAAAYGAAGVAQSGSVLDVLAETGDEILAEAEAMLWLQRGQRAMTDIESQVLWDEGQRLLGYSAPDRSLSRIGDLLGTGAKVAEGLDTIFN